MAESLETKAGKAVLRIEKKVNGIYAILRDFCMYSAMPRSNDYYELDE